MIITFVVEAKYLENGITVRKEKGETRYVLNKTVNVHVVGQSPQVIKSEGVVFICSGPSIIGIPDTTRLAVDVDYSESEDFLANILEYTRSYK